MMRSGVSGLIFGFQRVAGITTGGAGSRMSIFCDSAQSVVSSGSVSGDVESER